MKKHVFELLQDWYYSKCDGDWEHEFGIKIDTLDNPGWSISIDLKFTELANKEFTEIDKQISENNWVQCKVDKERFIGAGGPQNLTEIIEIFFNWTQ